MGKVRFQMFLDEEQKKTLEMLQRDTKTPMAEIIRDAVNRLIVEYKRKKALPVRDATTDKLLSIAGVCEGGPHDLADGHDKYLYGTKKK
jgi:ribbon-helix-helix CopG family protein